MSPCFSTAQSPTAPPKDWPNRQDSRPRICRRRGKVQNVCLSLPLLLFPQMLTNKSALRKNARHYRKIAKLTGTQCEVNSSNLLSICPGSTPISAAMTSSQARIAETLETFYGAADQSSEGAMAGHAYKRSVDDLDSSFLRELVRRSSSCSTYPASNSCSSGCSISDYHLGTSWQDVRIFPRRKRACLQAQ